MQKTTNYELNVIEQSDKILESVTALGDNATMLDTILNDKVTASLVTAINSSSTDGEVPSAKCVYDAIQSGGGGVVPVVNDIRIWTTSDGIYELPTGCTIYYDGASGVVGTSTESPAFLFINTYDALTKYWWAVPFGSRIIYGNTTETSGNYQTFYFASDYEHTSNKTSAINSSSTIYTYPNTQAVYYYGQNIQSTLQTEVDTLKAQIPTTTATGETITITDSSNLALKDFQLKGNANQYTTTGKNLFDKNNPNSLNAYINGNTGELIENANAKTIWINCSSSTTYTISRKAGQRFVVGSATANTIGTVVNVKQQGNTSSSLTITTGASDTYLLVFYYLSTADTLTEEAIRDTLQIETGSSATSYEPYTGGKASPNPNYPQNVNVVTGDNTIKIASTNLFNSTWVSGIIDSTSGNKKADTNFVCTDNYISVIPNQHYAIYRSPNIGYTNVRGYDINHTYVGAGSQAITYISGQNGTVSNPMQGGASYCVIAPKDGVYYLKWNCNTANTELEWNMVLGDTHSTTYTPYIEPQSQLLSLGSIELAKIGDYQDRIYKSGGKWYVEKNIGKYTFTGNESWGITTNGSYAYNMFNLTDTTDYFTNYIRTSGLTNICNYFKAIENKAGSSPVFAGGENVCCFRYNINDEINAFYITNGASSAATFKTLIGTIKPTVFYALATPTTTEITDTTLLGQLEELMQKTTYKNTTNVYSIVTGTNATGTLEVGYYQDIQTLINNALNA